LSELVIRCATPDDWPAVAKLGARVFSDQNTGYEKMRRGWLGLRNNPLFRWENTRIGLVDGQIVAHVSFLDQVLCCGQARLRFGGVVGVCTHPDYRKRGYAAQLMGDVLRQMGQEGYHLSLLDGVPRFYDRFGYVTVWPNRGLKFTAREAQRLSADGSGYRVRPYQESDLPALLALYQQEWAAHPVWIKRSPEWWRWRLDRMPDTGHPFTFVVENGGGVVRGYSAGWRPADRTEVVAADCFTTTALLRHTAELLRDEPDATVFWLDLPDSRVSRFVAQVCSVHYNTWANYRGGWMARFINVQAALDALRPELAARLETLNVPEAGDVTCEARRDTVILHIGAAEIVLLQSEFLLLLFGNWLPQDVDEHFGGVMGAAERDLLKRLFPPAINGLAGLDWF
jgi:predicted N-acetyltransferase YhbS